jgi:hypothetical protein
MPFSQKSGDAFKAREPEKPRVIIRAFSQDTKTVVTIADNAGGIPEAITGKIIDFIFRPRNRAEARESACISKKNGYWCG